MVTMLPHSATANSRPRHGKDTLVNLSIMKILEDNMTNLRASTDETGSPTDAQLVLEFVEATPVTSTEEARFPMWELAMSERTLSAEATAEILRIRDENPPPTTTSDVRDVDRVRRIISPHRPQE